MVDLKPLLEVAKRAALAAGEVIKPEMGKIHHYREKGENDFVTDVDIRAEEAIRRVILWEFPEHEILSEEAGEWGKSDFRWIVDPLDGTKNFIHGFPHVAVSIGLQVKGELVVGAILDVARDNLYFAAKGMGAYRNNERIRVSGERELSRAMVATGFPFRRKEFLDDYLRLFKKVFLNVSAVRRVGAAALDLAYVASGMFDGFFEFYLAPWDVAAGTVIVREAGGIAEPIGGGNELSGNIIAATPEIFDSLKKLVEEE